MECYCQVSRSNRVTTWLSKMPMACSPVVGRAREMPGRSRGEPQLSGGVRWDAPTKDAATVRRVEGDSPSEMI